jgi:hypothetical protein
MATVVEDPTSGTQLTSENVAHNWRVEQYLAMGFNADESDKLADAKEVSFTGGMDKNSKRIRWEVPLHHAKVKKALRGGCTHAQALGIFLP